ncbi:DUF6485 family protein [Christensenella intestinihominis]|uniref:DUF6485 family protein n=1 Tax=Christensenella intestinihominis TaxID=1851429 RepID=UPI000829CC9F|nr:DUF6485 family protein [Christensenella intestinihominis]
MRNLSEFCTCRDIACKLHPTRHDKGCAPCIRKNLNSREIPSCFFNLLDHAGHPDGYSFEEFANLVSAERAK